MTYSNQKMQRLLRRGLDVIKPETLAMADKQIDKLFGELRSENGCLFLSAHNGKADASNVTDRVEFEACFNEILINRLFPKKKVTAALALTFYSMFNARLSVEYPQKFCAILSEDNGRWTFRFHTVRERVDETPTLEPLWISEDLEKFAQPIMYDVFGGEDDKL